jgi:AbrB family looped-hinge helix DNA binding protein
MFPVSATQWRWAPCNSLSHRGKRQGNIDRAFFSAIVYYIITFYENKMKSVKVRIVMPLVKVIRNGQITIPKELRSVLGIEEGDLLEVKLNKGGMTIKPKTAVDKDLAKGRFFQMAEQIRESMKDADPQEVEAALAEAVQVAKKATTKRMKAQRS